MYLAMREEEKDNINPDHYKISAIAMHRFY